MPDVSNNDANIHLPTIPLLTHLTPADPDENHASTLTFKPSSDDFPGIAAEVKDDESEAVNIPIIAIPIVIQKTAKILPGIERGALSPYLNGIITVFGYCRDMYQVCFCALIKTTTIAHYARCCSTDSEKGYKVTESSLQVRLTTFLH